MDAPALSVVILIGSMRQRAARSLQTVLKQKTQKPIQIIVADTQPSYPRIEGWDAENVIYQEYPDAPSVTFVRVSALPSCSSEFIAFVEDHAFVDPEWAEGVLKGFQTGADVVVYTYSNATPESLYSRAFGLINYGRWGSEKLAGEHQNGPGNNIAYRRAVLLRQGDQLEELMHIEWFLLRAIREQGGKIYQEPTARMAHANWDTLLGTLLDTCTYSRLFACQRINLEKLSVFKRLFYAASMPLLPTLLLWRFYQAFKPDSNLLRLFILRSPLILFLLVCTSLSEAIGYLNNSPPFRSMLDVEVNLPRACD